MNVRDDSLKKKPNHKPSQKTAPPPSSAGSASAHLKDMQSSIGNQALIRLLGAGALLASGKEEADEEAQSTALPKDNRSGLNSKKNKPAENDSEHVNTFWVRPLGSGASMEQVQRLAEQSLKLEQQHKTGQKASQTREGLLQSVSKRIPMINYEGFTGGLTAKPDAEMPYLTWTSPSKKVNYKVHSTGEGARLKIEVLVAENSNNDTVRSQTTQAWVQNHIPRLSTHYVNELIGLLEAQQAELKQRLNPSILEEEQDDSYVFDESPNDDEDEHNG